MSNIITVRFCLAFVSDAVTLNYFKNLAQLVSNLSDDKRDDTDGGISMKVLKMMR